MYYIIQILKKLRSCPYMAQIRDVHEDSRTIRIVLGECDSSEIEQRKCMLKNLYFCFYLLE